MNKRPEKWNALRIHPQIVTSFKTTTDVDPVTHVLTAVSIEIIFRKVQVYFIVWRWDITSKSRYVDKTILVVNISICLHVSEWQIGIDSPFYARVSTTRNEMNASFYRTSTPQNARRKMFTVKFFRTFSIFFVLLILFPIFLSKWVIFVTSYILSWLSQF